MTTRPEEVVIEVLTHDGLSARDWLLIEDLPLAWHPTGGPLACLIEEASLAEAFVNHLRGLGVRSFTSWEEVVQMATRENWPGVAVERGEA